jgi:hypothetical protein
MILQAIDIQKYVPLQTSSFSFDKYAGFETRALYKHFTRFLGNTLVDALAGDTPDDNLKLKVIPVLANLAVLEATPFLDVVLTSYGFGVVRNNNIAPASRERVAAFIAACEKAANDFMDILLTFLEDNVATYTTWNQSSLNTGSLIPTTTVFNTQTKLNLKRHQFVDLKSNLAHLETTFFAQTLSAEFLTGLQEGADTVVKPFFQKALAFMAYADMMHDANPESNSGVWKQKGMMFMARGQSLLIDKIDDYETYSTYGYEAPYDNDDVDNEDSGFFIAGGTA